LDSKSSKGVSVSELDKICSDSLGIHIIGIPRPECIIIFLPNIFFNMSNLSPNLLFKCQLMKKKGHILCEFKFLMDHSISCSLRSLVPFNLRLTDHSFFTMWPSNQFEFETSAQQQRHEMKKEQCVTSIKQWTGCSW